MSISNVSQVKSIAIKLGATSNDIVAIYTNNNLFAGTQYKPGYTVVSFNCFIKNLKVFSKINSLEEAPLPDFAIDDSATAKLTKTLDVEWKSPRKQLNVYITNAANPSYIDWHQIGSISLLNPYGYPFRVYNIMDLFTDNLALELGENGKIGVQIENVGYGLLTNADSVTVHGSCVEEIFIESPDLPNIININLTGIAGVTNTTSTLISNDTLVDNTFLVGN